MPERSLSGALSDPEPEPPAIAYPSAMPDWEALYDIDDQRLEASRAQLLRSLDAVVTYDAVSPARREEIVSRLRATASMEKAVRGRPPLRPPPLIPLVEITAGDRTAPEPLTTVYAFYQSIGKEAVLLRREPRLIANRLQLALYREVQDLVMRGACTVEDADKALAYGPGLRWSIFGHNMIMQLGNPGGLTGMVQMLGDSGDAWLADMASRTHQPKDWSQVAQPGVDEEMRRFPDYIGHTNAECAAHRDKMLIELLRLHRKL